MEEHALLSASSSHRWLCCTPSAKLEESFENKSSVFAEEGTAAHALAEYKLKKYFGEKVKKPKSNFDEKELEYYTDIYFDYACELISEAKARSKDPIILVEQKLDFSNYVPEGFGTGDLVIVADEILDIMDLKYGKGVEVSAINNPQIMLYAIGALNLFDSLYDIEKIRMTICQPRLDNISTFEITVDEITKWAENKVKPKAELAIKGEGEFCAGEHCRFCRAKFNCRARAEENMKMAQYDFKKGPFLTDDEITEILSNIDEFQKWASDIQAYALDKAINENKKWDGFKLVEGRSSRKYSDEEAKKEGVAKLGGKIPKNLKTPLRDGDIDRPEDEAYADSYFINANSNTKPGIVDKDVQSILDQSEFYSGCYGRASIVFYAYNANGNKGIACGLQNLQKIEDGEPLGGHSRAEDDFDAIEEDFLD